jgi:5-(carboxyamino)imidazole ribonucleotide synthase
MHIAIFGCGQLARMLAIAGWPMGLTFSFLAEENENDSCVRGLGKVVRRVESKSVDWLYQALGRPSVITVEKENVDVGLMKQLQQFCKVYPDPEIIYICQHRGREKQFLQTVGAETAGFELINNMSELSSSIKRLGFPVIIKSCEQGYDGQNQWSLNDDREYAAFANANRQLPESVVESRVRFLREISLLLVRSRDGQMLAYPPTENLHVNGTLLTSFAPADNLLPAIETQITSLVTKIMAGWDYVGLLAIECFVTADRVLVNELAPRVHNSGHWTQQGAMTSQFENHLRAITGMALGSTQAHGYTAMLNLLGRTTQASSMGMANAYLHLYNKTVRPGRKIGHINLFSHDKSGLKDQLNKMVGNIYTEPEVIKHYAKANL